MLYYIYNFSFISININILVNDNNPFPMNFTNYLDHTGPEDISKQRQIISLLSEIVFSEAVFKLFSEAVTTSRKAVFH